MLLDLREKIIFQQVKAKGPSALYHTFLRKRGSDLLNETSIEYLKAFVQHPISVCIRIIRSAENTHLTTSVWGDEYIDLISQIAAYHLDKNEITQGLLWADKAISLVDYFAPTMKKEMREEILYNLPASSMICAFPKQYLKAPCQSFYLQWEFHKFNTTHSRSPFNDN